jgi:hypothetical protein
MWFVSLLRRLTQADGWHRAGCPSHQVSRRRRFLPRLEALEDRALPSTFTVVNLADSGPGSLRRAVLDANSHPGADVIDFAVTGTITLTSGQLTISDNVTINGSGADQLTISGNDASRVFLIDSGSVVAMSGLTIAHGRAAVATPVPSTSIPLITLGGGTTAAP